MRRTFPSRTFGAYRPWLTDNGSLTAAIRSKSRHFAVQPLHQRMVHGCLGAVERLPASAVIVREVYLFADGRPVIFARSLLPLASLRGKWRQLGRMRNRPLGQALFAARGARRTKVIFERLRPRHPLYRQAAEHLGTAPEALWARTSIFLVSGRPILVTEVFLPALLELA